MCDNCMDDTEYAQYMDDMQTECLGPDDSQIKNVHLLSAATSNGSVCIAQETDVAVISENGVTVERRKNVVVIPPEQMEGLAKFIVAQFMRIAEEEEENGHER